MFAKIKARWPEEAGYRQLLKVAFPLILSSGSTSILLFVDRMLLSWYSNEAIAAALPTGILNWTFICVFFGMAMYTSTFVAQYTGANRPERVGASIWQGLYISLIGSILIPLIAPFSEEIFAVIGHAPRIQEMEAEYLKILNCCTFFFLANAILSCFYSGRGKAWTIVWINVLLTILNTIFDWILIFGNWGFPEMGIKGAGYATFASSGIVVAIYFILFLSPKNERIYSTRSAWHLDKDLCRRMLKFGFPAGMHFFLDVIGFTIFTMLVGRLGVVDAAANNITQQIHLLGLLPLVGLGIANTIMVGQYQGAGKSDLAERASYSSMQMAFLYNALVSITYLLVPYLFIAPFFAAREVPPSQELIDLITNLLKLVALFSLFEGVVIISSGTLKGAGDTAFVMRTLAITSVLLVIVPTVVVIEILQLPLLWAWGVLTINLLALSTIFFLRVRSGKWKQNKVIEE
ncbi:MATE family efflux transporter [Pelagicoccus mobilis]|uniref:Multidrug-efflux transporter n=1 Tax=Pelagicoccus mobilis TaxID=415221 RepID=A0A934VPL0_9BACT|nr:MATE family efflux transporter [Pelagicoccus mobilis]MBK1877402.1 MATE family efflux transporter [Pelagicoccus mobilis]